MVDEFKGVDQERREAIRLTDIWRSLLRVFWREARALGQVTKALGMARWVLLRHLVDRGDQDVASKPGVVDPLAAVVPE